MNTVVVELPHAQIESDSVGRTPAMIACMEFEAELSAPRNAREEEASAAANSSSDGSTPPGAPAARSSDEAFTWAEVRSTALPQFPVHIETDPERNPSLNRLRRRLSKRRRRATSSRSSTKTRSSPRRMRRRLSSFLSHRLPRLPTFISLQITLSWVIWTSSSWILQEPQTLPRTLRRLLLTLSTLLRSLRRLPARLSLTSPTVGTFLLSGSFVGTIRSSLSCLREATLNLTVKHCAVTLGAREGRHRSCQGLRGHHRQEGRRQGGAQGLPAHHDDHGDPRQQDSAAPCGVRGPLRTRKSLQPLLQTVLGEVPGSVQRDVPWSGRRHEL